MTATPFVTKMFNITQGEFVMKAAEGKKCLFVYILKKCI